MKFIRNSNNELVNLDMMEYIRIEDYGADHKERFEVIASNQNREFSLKIYRTEEGARKFMKKLYEQSKIEIDA